MAGVGKGLPLGLIRSAGNSLMTIFLQVLGDVLGGCYVLVQKKWELLFEVCLQTVPLSTVFQGHCRLLGQGQCNPLR